MVSPTVTRDQLIARLEISHAEAGQLLRERYLPMPVRVEGAILWFDDEVSQATSDASLKKLIERRRTRRAKK